MHFTFYSGESMSPEAIRAADPAAAFIARGWIAVNAGELPDEFVPLVGDELWGIVVETSAPPAGGPVEVTLDDGRAVEASLADPLLAGDPKVVLANARYWELPPAYVATLKAIIEPGLAEE